MSRPRTVAFFGPERTDARSVKRIAALADQGWQVLGFTFHRDRGQPDPPPAWENIHLGTTYNRRYLQRIWAILRGFCVVFAQRRRLRESAALYAINPDNALLALFGRLVCGRRVPLVVEIADIQPAMTGSGVVSRVLRALERFVLNRSQLLLTTSPGFIRNYFTPVQAYAGPVFLLENKIYPASALISNRIPRTRPVSGGAPWVIGYFGVFRCARSLEIIRTLAERFPDRVKFVLRGIPAGVDEGLFREMVSELPNIDYGGPYRYPDQLPELYAAVDMNWCFDFSASGGNSTWLLPNRIYEGGLFHCPALAYENTETAAWLATNGLGWFFGENLSDKLCQFVQNLHVEEWLAMSQNCAMASDDLFAGEGDYVRLSNALARLGEGEQEGRTP